MRDLHIHLSSGTELAWPLDDATAAGVVRTVHDFWHGQRIDDPVLRITGDDGDPDGDSRFPMAHIVGVQSFPADEPPVDGAGACQDDGEVHADAGPGDFDV